MIFMSAVTATQMYNYAKSHKVCSEISSSWTLKHFQLIADSIASDERVLTAFCGFHNYISMSKHDGIFAYAITNKRFILAQKKMIGSVFQSISLQNINDITMSKNFLSHTVTIDTMKETFNVEASDAVTIQNIYNEINKAIETAKRMNTSRQAVQPSGNGNVTTQLMELKKLLDAGIINQNDFEAKKKQILGI